tara:strand:- start:5768 stop:6982 length:1215 start_codon:yes stop_codon:yes gene_type:complete
MGAGLGWIDFSNAQRDRVFSVVDLLSEGGTVDELGIGSVRDSIADWLFPGVSTIQTRPKYFIILTEIFLEYLKKYQKGEKVPQLAKYLKDEEHRIMHLLAKNHSYKDGDGVIGVTVAQNNGELARKASSVYWNGLRVHKLIDTEFSSSEYLLQNDLSNIDYSGSRNTSDPDDGLLLEQHFSINTPFFNCVKEDMRMELSELEANYLRDQFRDTASNLKQNNNLLSQLFTEERAKIVATSNNFQEMANQLLFDDELNDETKRILKIAILFDFVLHGAHIRYNIQLHKRSGELSFDDKWNEWLMELETRRKDVEELDFDYIFSEVSPRTNSETQSFMKFWKEEVLNLQLNIELLDKLVYRQEVRKKGAKAKLTSVNGEFTHWIGLQSLQYRFNIVKNIVKDIQVHA